MRKLSLIVFCAGAVMLSLAVPAYAQTDLPENVTLNTSSGVPGATVNAAEAAALSNEEVEKALANAIRQSLNQQEEAEDAAADEETDEPKKKYRYEKKDGPFSQGELPKRTFNNIPYPY